MSDSPFPHAGTEKSPSAFQPPNRPQLPSSPVEDETPPPVPAKGSSPPSTPLNSQTPSSTMAAHARPGTPDFFLTNSSYSMPGAYPVTAENTPLPTPLATGPSKQSAATSTSYTPDPSIRPAGNKRQSSSSIRNLLTSLRRSSGREQPKQTDDSLERSPTNRPETPSNGSMVSSTRPLRKKMSGSFWTRRKSSLGTEVVLGRGDQAEGQEDQRQPSTPVTGQNGHASSPPSFPSAGSPKDPSEGGSIINSIRKRKSGTFWGKRKSSLAMEASTSPSHVASDEIYRGHARVSSTASASGPSSVNRSPPQPLRKKQSESFWKRKPSLNLDRSATPTHLNGNGLGSSPTQPIKENTADDGSEVRFSEAESYVQAERSDSPPPKLPELNLGVGSEEGSGLLDDGADDMFANIGKD